MQKDKNRLGKSEKADQENSNKAQSHLQDTSINFDVAKIFYPNNDNEITRRYSIDDNGGGYLGL